MSTEGPDTSTPGSTNAMKLGFEERPHKEISVGETSRGYRTEVEHDASYYFSESLSRMASTMLAGIRLWSSKADAKEKSMKATEKN